LNNCQPEADEPMAQKFNENCKLIIENYAPISSSIFISRLYFASRSPQKNIYELIWRFI